MCVCVCVCYISISIYLSIYLYIYIYIERERERVCMYDIAKQISHFPYSQLSVFFTHNQLADRLQVLSRCTNDDAYGKETRMISGQTTVNMSEVSFSEYL